MEEGKQRYDADLGRSLGQVHVIAKVRPLGSFAVVWRYSFGAAGLNPLHNDSSTEPLLVEKQTVAAPAAPSFGTEETSGSEEKPFSQAHTQVDFAAQEAKLARRKNLAAAEERFPSLR
jgi:hypothetical protein